MTHGGQKQNVRKGINGAEIEGSLIVQLEPMKGQYSTE